MAEKVEFASQEWLDELHKLIVKYTEKAGPEVTLSLCEVFTGVPGHLDKDGTGKITWYCRIRNGDVEFSRGEIDDADYKSTADYQYILPHAKLTLDPANMADIDAEHEKAISEGKLKREGERAKIPAAFYGMHNDIAMITK